MCVLLAQQPHKKETRMKQALSPGPLWGSTVQYLLQTPRKLSKSYSFCCSFDRKSKVVLLVSHLTLSKVFSRLCTIPAQQRPLPGQIPKAGKAQKNLKFKSQCIRSDHRQWSNFKETPIPFAWPGKYLCWLLPANHFLWAGCSHPCESAGWVLRGCTSCSVLGVPCSVPQPSHTSYSCPCCFCLPAWGTPKPLSPLSLSPLNADPHIRAYSNSQHNQSKFAPDVCLFFR